MRIIGILPDKEQVGFLVDSLRNEGFEREDMVITDISKSYADPGEDADVAYLKNENDSLNNPDPYPDFLLGEVREGLVVAVDSSKHRADRVRMLMEQNGATKIIQD